jgi:hypothetical protein
LSLLFLMGVGLNLRTARMSPMEECVESC